MPTEILGDIMSSATWGKLDESMMARGISNLDLVVMRPEGGWQINSFYRVESLRILALTYIIRNVAKRLNPTGRFYFVVPIPPRLPTLVSEHPALKALQKSVSDLTPFKLILKTRPLPGKTVDHLEGALMP